MSVGFGRRLGVATAIVGVALALALAASGQASEPVSCAYVEAGEPGPEENILSVDDRSNTVTHIFRQDDAIAVHNNAVSDPIVCAGESPTVFNVDRIEYSTATGVLYLNYSGDGPLAPGATLEPSGSEIEVSIHEEYQPGVLNVAGSTAAETIVVGQLGPHQVGANLNSKADGAAQDVDVILDALDPSRLKARVVGKGGDDTLSALGGPGFSASFPADLLALSGGPGDDTLVGGPHNDLIRGDAGDDTLLGGRGRDRLTIGPGTDLAQAGKGSDRILNESDVGGIPPDSAPDRVYAGAGDDEVDVSRTLRGDFVSCGAGRDDLARVDPGDRAKACETVDVEPH